MNEVKNGARLLTSTQSNPYVQDLGKIDDNHLIFLSPAEKERRPLIGLPKGGKCRGRTCSVLSGAPGIRLLHDIVKNLEQAFYISELLNVVLSSEMVRARLWTPRDLN